MADVHRLVSPRKILVKDLNEQITCSLCGGYFIDATTLIDCLHTFCRACIVRHFESSKLCPNCSVVVHKNKPLTCLRTDTVVQTLVYKLVPALYSKELQRRADFYHSTNFRPNSACSDDSVLGDKIDSEEWALANIGDPSLYYSPDDSISLSLEYYKHKSETDDSKPVDDTSDKPVSETPINKDSDIKTVSENNETTSDDKCSSSENNVVNGYKRFLQCPAAVTMAHIMKFLRMKYALTEGHRVDIIYDEEVLPQYFSLMDVAYTFNWKRDGPMRLYFRIFVPVIRPEIPLVLPKQEITIPDKTDPKNDNTTKKDMSNEVLQQEHEELKKDEKKPEKSVKFAEKSPEKTKTYENCVYDYTEPDKDEIKAFAEKRDREWALQKQEEEYNHVSKKRKKNKHSKSEFVHKKRKLHAEITSNEVPEESLKLKVKLSVANGHKHKHRNFEPPKQELTPKERLLQMRQVRHKKIESTDEKNGKKPDPIIPQYKVVPLDKKEENKEKVKAEKSPDILMTGKTLRSDFTNKTLISKDLCSKFVSVNVERCNEANKLNQRKIEKDLKLLESKNLAENKVKMNNEVNKIKLNNDPNKMKMNQEKNNVKLSVDANKIKVNSETNKIRLSNEVNKIRLSNEGSKKLGSEVGKVKLGEVNKVKLGEVNKVKLGEVNKAKLGEMNNKAKLGEMNKPKLGEMNKPKLGEVNKVKLGEVNKVKLSEVNKPKLTEVNKQKLNELNKAKICEMNKAKLCEANKAKLSEANKTKLGEMNKVKVEQKEKSPEIPIVDKIKEEPGIKEEMEKSHFNSNEYVTKNFTVSKIETGVKRKAEDKPATVEKRPSLEITLINPIQKADTTPKPNKPNRPPPPPIPLVRIQKSLSLKSGISIIPKMSEKCDNYGALDLSSKISKDKPEIFRSHSESPRPTNHPIIPRSNSVSPKITNSITPKTPQTDEKVPPNITNLQMLSESAVQMQELLAKTPPIPNLIKKSPPLKIPIPQNSGMKSPSFIQKNLIQNKPPFIQNKSPLLTKPNNAIFQKSPIIPKTLQKLPNLKEINKSQFNRLNPAIRNARPAQNQSIRNIPNPSLIVRQQNQNRINSLANQHTEVKDAPKVPTKSCTEELKKDLEITKNIPALKQIETTVSK